jgi:hypothetical protein
MIAEIEDKSKQLADASERKSPRLDTSVSAARGLELVQVLTGCVREHHRFQCQVLADPIWRSRGCGANLAGQLERDGSGMPDIRRESDQPRGHPSRDRPAHGAGPQAGGYGHGLAADVVSVKGETRAQRWLSTEILWKWIDAHGKEYGIGRPYLDKDPPHIAPIDGKEYADKRGVNAKLAGKGSAATGRDPKMAKSPQAFLQQRGEHKPL